MNEYLNKINYVLDSRIKNLKPTLRQQLYDELSEMNLSTKDKGRKIY